MIFKIVTENPMDIAGMESWLNEQSEKGLELKFMVLNTVAAFKKCEKGKYKYVLEPKRDFEENENNDRLDFYKSFGWQFVCKFANLFYIMKAEKDAEELYTDRELQAEVYGTVKKSSFRSLIFTIIITAIVLGFGIAFGDFSPYGLAKKNINLTILLLMIVMPFFLLSSIIDYVIFKRFFKAIERGEKPKIKSRKVYRIFNLAMLMAAMIILLAHYIVPFIQYTSVESVGIEQAEDFVYLKMSDIYGDEYRTVEGMRYEGKDFSNYFERRSTNLLSEYVEITQTGEVKGAETGMLMRFYDTRINSMAVPLIEDYMSKIPLGDRYIGRNYDEYSVYPYKTFEEGTVKTEQRDDFDFFAYGEHGGAQHLFCALNGRAAYISFYGDKKLTDYTEEIKEILKQ